MTAILEIAGLSKRFRLGPTGRSNFREAISASARNLAAFSWLRPSEPKWHWALRDINYSVKPGECVGIIGNNGAGKSTLLKILSRITDPTEGFVNVRGRIASLLEVGTGFHPELTGRENIYMSAAILGMTRAEIRARFDQIVAFAEIDQFLDTPLKRYSSGMQVRLGFAVAAHLDPEILIIDEVLAVGDMAFQKKCLGRIDEFGRSGRTVLFVSHNMAVVQNLCTKAIVMREGRIIFAGDTRSAVNHYVNFVSTQNESNGSHVVDLTSALGRWARCIPTLRKLEVYTGDASPCNGFVAIGASLKLVVTFRLAPPTPDFEIRLNLVDIFGQIIFHACSGFEPHRSWGASSGEQTISCEIRSLQLTPGEYRIDLAIMNASMELLDFVEGAFRVTVIDADYYGTGRVPEWGLCVLEQRWREEGTVRDRGVILPAANVT
jgi:lipopolysaccharide transport system ATP-binding protein